MNQTKRLVFYATLIFSLVACGAKRGADVDSLAGPWIIESIIENGTTRPNSSQYIRFQGGKFLLVLSQPGAGATPRERYVVCPERPYTFNGQSILVSAGGGCNAQEFRVVEIGQLRLRYTDTFRPNAQQVYLRKSSEEFGAFMQGAGLTEADFQ